MSKKLTRGEQLHVLLALARSVAGMRDDVARRKEMGSHWRSSAAELHRQEHVFFTAFMEADVATLLTRVVDVIDARSEWKKQDLRDLRALQAAQKAWSRLSDARHAFEDYLQSCAFKAGWDCPGTLSRNFTWHWYPEVGTTLCGAITLSSREKFRVESLQADTPHVCKRCKRLLEKERTS